MPKHTKAEQAKNKQFDGKTGAAKTFVGAANRRISDIQKEINRLTKLKKKMMSK